MFPLEIMHNILSRMPVKSLARCRCVSKQWCNLINDSYLEAMHAKRAAGNDLERIMFHQYPSEGYTNSPCTLSFLDHKEEVDSCTLEVRKKPPVMKFMCKSWSHIVLGSCNGLLYSLEISYDGNRLVVIHPLRKECYKLPPIKTPFHLQQSWGIDVQVWNCLRVEESSGLGFDDSTNTFKMVSVVLRLREDHEPQNDLHQLKEDLWTMVHVLGTDSWRKLPQVPSYPITGEGMFANGRLHWLVRYKYNHYAGKAYFIRSIITFDMAKEEFGLMNPPHGLPDSGRVNEQLVDLQGEVGYVCHIVNRKVEVWVLKEGGWVMHCEFEHKPPLPRGFLKVSGFWNDNGDVLVTDNWKQKMFVYNLKSDSFHELNFVGLEKGLLEIRMYRSSLFSTRYSIKQN